MALESDLGLRNFKAENGECWNEVKDRAESFIYEQLEAFLSEEERKLERVDIEEELRSCEGGGKIEPLNDEDLESKINPDLGVPTAALIKSQSSDLSLLNYELKSILKKKVEAWRLKNPKPKRILIVTHVGFISEFYNVMKEFNGISITSKYNAKNTACYIFGLSKNPLKLQGDTIPSKFTVKNLLINH